LEAAAITLDAVAAAAAAEEELTAASDAFFSLFFLFCDFCDILQASLPNYHQSISDLVKWL
jgi:hypothetical protein